MPDLNGDENDGLDEALVVYDTKRNRRRRVISGALIDDEMELMLSKISAKKLIIVDACHSGSIYRGIEYEYTTKFVNSDLKNYTHDEISQDIAKREVQHPSTLLVLSASGDNESAIDSPEGGLFTSALYDTLMATPNISFEDLKSKITDIIKDQWGLAKGGRYEFKIFAPMLYASKGISTSQSFNDFTNVNIKIDSVNTVEDYFDDLLNSSRVAKMKIISKKRVYNRGEYIYFDIDSRGNSGYLYLFTIDDNGEEIDVLYPNPYFKKPQIVSYSFNFPPQRGEFHFKAVNRIGRKERTVVYAIISPRIIKAFELSRQEGNSKFQSIARDFDSQIGMKNAIKDIIVRRTDNKIAIAKSVFSVR